MNTPETLAEGTSPKAPDDGLPLIALASAATLAGTATLLVASLFPGRNRRASLVGQVCLGALAAGVAAVVWNKRQEEIAAARHLMTHIHEVRDTRWLKKHPIAYG
jgi:hypothetical protein